MILNILIGIAGLLLVALGCCLASLWSREVGAHNISLEQQVREKAAALLLFDVRHEALIERHRKLENRMTELKLAVGDADLDIVFVPEKIEHAHLRLKAKRK